MKINSRLFRISIATAIYCFAIVLFSKSLAQSDVKYYPTSSAEQQISDLTPKLFCHTSNSESSVNYSNFNLSTNLKNVFTDFCERLLIIGQLIGSEISQYVIVMKSLLIELKKLDLIFPFHYFW